MTSGWFANGQESLSARLRRLRPPMTDAEFAARYDPPSSQEVLMLNLLQDIKTLLDLQNSEPQRGITWREYQPRKGANQPSGPVAIP